MSETPSSAVDTANTIELSPSYAIPLGLMAIALLLFWVLPWVSVPLALFGLFLLFQTVSLRLQFTDQALAVYRGDRQIRYFPYENWQNWEIFWSPVPILFYFREINSIHFLPIIFSPVQLRASLEKYVPLSTEANRS